MIISDPKYLANVTAARLGVTKALRDPKLAEMVKRIKSLNPDPQEKDPAKRWSIDHPIVKAAARGLIKAGLTTSTGFNFYDLRGPAYFLFPYNTPFLQMIARRGKVNAGVGTAAHWKATRNPNSTNVYAGVGEGKRNATATPDEIDYLATYKELGMEGGETFTAQWAGEGYTDNLADEHFRNLARLRLQEEMITLLGNSGTATGNLGFALGTANTPTITQRTAAASELAIKTGDTITVAVVFVTGMGMNPAGQGGYVAPPTVAAGLTPSYSRANVDGSSDTINGGISAISAVSVTTITVGAGNVVVAKVTPKAGTMGYAWFVSLNGSPTLANSFIYGITNVPTVVIQGATAGADPALGSQAGNAAGLNADHSFQATDFDGLLTYTFVNGRWIDMANGSFTPSGNGLVQELEDDLKFLWDNYQAQPSAIWCSSDVRRTLDQAILFSASGTNSYIFQYTKDSQGDLLGGFLVSAYKSKYSINQLGGAAIPIRLHPMLPAGTIYYDINENPYPHSRIPDVRAFLMQRDYYAVEWPIVSRQWTFGTYVHEVLAHYMPWISAVRTGVGPFVAPCWIAAVVFNEDFWTGPRVSLVRRWLVNDYEKTAVGRVVVSLYRRYGQRLACEIAQRGGLLHRAFRALFNVALRKAEARYGTVAV